jgi:hypothetical protein
MGNSSKTPPSGAGALARSKINPTPTSSRTASRPANKLATQAGNSSKKKVEHSDFKAPHVGPSKRLQDGSRAPEEHSSTPNKKIGHSDFMAHHARKHLQDAKQEDRALGLQGSLLDAMLMMMMR